MPTLGSSLSPLCDRRCSSERLTLLSHLRVRALRQLTSVSLELGSRAVRTLRCVPHRPSVALLPQFIGLFVVERLGRSLVHCRPPSSSLGTAACLVVVSFLPCSHSFSFFGSKASSLQMCIYSGGCHTFVHYTTVLQWLATPFYHLKGHGFESPLGQISL